MNGRDSAHVAGAIAWAASPTLTNLGARRRCALVPNASALLVSPFTASKVAAERDVCEGNVLVERRVTVRGVELWGRVARWTPRRGRRGSVRAISRRMRREGCLRTGLDVLLAGRRVRGALGQVFWHVLWLRVGHLVSALGLISRDERRWSGARATLNPNVGKEKLHRKLPCCLLAWREHLAGGRGYLSPLSKRDPYSRNLQLPIMLEPRR